MPLQVVVTLKKMFARSGIAVLPKRYLKTFQIETDTASRGCDVSFRLL